MSYIAYIGTNSIRDSRGIYTVEIDGGGHGRVAGATPAYNSGYLALSADGSRLYASSEGMSFHGRASGGVTAYDVTGGVPRELNWRFSGGQRPCCLSLSEDGRELYAANFFGGSIAVFPIAEDGSLCERRCLIKEQPLAGRLDGMHCVEAMPNGEFGAVYLGTGSVIIYDAETCAEKQRFSLTGGAFPRHFTATEDGEHLYLLLQTPSELHVAARGRDGKFEVRQVVSAVHEGFTGHAEAAAVRLTPDERLLIASTRVVNTLAVCRVDAQTGLLGKPEIVDLPVKTPRDIVFTPDGRFLLVTGQATDNICVYAVDSAAARIEYVDTIEGVVSPDSIVVREV